MADEKKIDDGPSILSILFYGLLLLFVMWLVTGGPSRTENKYNPFLREPAPLDDFSVYGDGSNFQTKTEDLLTEGKYIGWKIQTGKNFSFATPLVWTLQSSGTLEATEFGEITDGNIILQYQYGQNANQLNFENDPNYEIVFGKVNKQDAKFVRPKNSIAETTGAFIKRNKEKRITIFTNQELTAEQEKQVFEIINTIQI